VENEENNYAELSIELLNKQIDANRRLIIILFGVFITVLLSIPTIPFLIINNSVGPRLTKLENSEEKLLEKFQEGLEKNKKEFNKAIEKLENDINTINSNKKSLLSLKDLLEEAKNDDVIKKHSQQISLFLTSKNVDVLEQNFNDIKQKLKNKLSEMEKMENPEQAKEITNSLNSLINILENFGDTIDMMKTRNPFTILSNAKNAFDKENKAFDKENKVFGLRELQRLWQILNTAKYITVEDKVKLSVDSAIMLSESGIATSTTLASSFIRNAIGEDPYDCKAQVIHYALEPDKHSRETARSKLGELILKCGYDSEVVYYVAQYFIKIADYKGLKNVMELFLTQDSNSNSEKNARSYLEKAENILKD
jgi:hypothetical protein